MEIKSMKAAILVELDKPLVVAKVDLPEALSFGQVLVKVHYSGICGSQINEIKGAKGEDKYLPHLLGHEGSGTVLGMGPGVKAVKKGERVVLHWRPGQGLQGDVPGYLWDGRKVNAGQVTTFNEYAIVSENRITPIPEDFDLKLAPLFGCAVTTALGAVNNDACVKIGQSVVVFGVGGVGMNIVQGAQMVSANPIVAVDLYDSKLVMSRKFGATHCLNTNDIPDLRTAILSIVGANGADVIFETTGNPRVIEMAYELTQPQGKTVLIGVPLKGNNISIYSLPLHFNKVLTGSHGGSAEPHLDIPRYIRLCQSGRMKLDGLITHEFVLDEINEAVEIVRRGEAGRCVIKMGN